MTLKDINIVTNLTNNNNQNQQQGQKQNQDSTLLTV